MSDLIPVRGTCDPRFARVQELFQHSFDSGEEIGAAVSCVIDGKCVMDLWGGHYDPARTRARDRDTLVNVYSTTKGLTALRANQLIERGLLDIEAPVSQYWPEFAAAGKEKITIRWLLSHRAGLCGVRTPLPKDSLYDWDRMCDSLAATTMQWAAWRLRSAQSVSVSQ